MGVDAEDLVQHDDRWERAARLGHRTKAGKHAVNDRDAHVPRARPLVSVVIVVAATGCPASAKPALSPPAIMPREARARRQAQQLRSRQIQGRPPLLWLS